MINYDALMARKFPKIEHRYTAKDSILYALGLGLGTDPLNPSHLRATYEGAAGFGALPAMVNVIGYPGFWAMEPDTGLTWQKILHGEQGLTLHAPMPAEGTLIGQTRITGIVDKGEGRGALIYSERSLKDKDSGTPIATVTSTSFARGDGGFGGPDGPVKSVQPMPEGKPEVFHEFQTPESAALIYRLSGDLNPLHADPAVAKQVGFERPILHGLCSLGVASWSITEALAGGDFSKLQHLELRFTAPVYPGETIRTEMWQDDDNVRFRARVVERDVIVLNNGLARLA